MVRAPYHLNMKLTNLVFLIFGFAALAQAEPDSDEETTSSSAANGDDTMTTPASAAVRSSGSLANLVALTLPGALLIAANM